MMYRCPSPYVFDIQSRPYILYTNPPSIFCQPDTDLRHPIGDTGDRTTGASVNIDDTPQGGWRPHRSTTARTDCPQPVSVCRAGDEQPAVGGGGDGALTLFRGKTGENVIRENTTYRNVEKNKMVRKSWKVWWEIRCHNIT